jgi:hypothetical protein
MATEEDRQEERDRMDNDPYRHPPRKPLRKRTPFTAPLNPGQPMTSRARRHEQQPAWSSRVDSMAPAGRFTSKQASLERAD